MEAGANQRVTTDSGIVLDFAGLFGDSVEQKRPSKTPLETILEGGQYKTITEPKKPAEAPPEGLEGQQAKGLYLQAKREAAEKQRTLDIFREYQENIKRSGQLQTEILKAISLMTSNSLFYSQIEADTRAIYGEGLQEQAPLKCELAEVQKRLERLREAQAEELEHDSRERIGRAIQAHEAKIAQLQGKIDRANNSI